MNTKCTLSIDVGQFAVQMRCSGECSACAGTAQGYNAEKTAPAAKAARTAQTAAEAAAAAAAATEAEATKAAGAASIQRIAELMMRPLRRQGELLHHLRIIQEALDTPPYTNPLALHWRKVSDGDRGGSFAELLEKIKAFPKGQLWRHNQAGDLPGEGSRIDAQALAELVEANRGRKGFTYSHKPLTTANATLIAYANRNGFTVNVSANTLADADKVALRHPDLPICVVVPEGTPKRKKTPAGREVRLCPAEKKGSGINCANCKLCSKATRSYIIGFTVHGTTKKGYAAAVGQ